MGLSINKNPVTATKLLRRPREFVWRDSFARAELYESTLGLFLCFANALFENAHGKVRLLFVDEKRRRKPNGILARTEYAKSLVESQVNDGIAQIRRFFLRALIADNFNADHQATSANVANDLNFFVQSARRPKRYSPMRLAFSRYWLSISSAVARAAAMQTGFPPNVVPWAPGFQFIMLAGANIAPAACRWRCLWRCR